jgi:peptidoglycan/xylan/chitin deacetylase (PgdA/CDA1 family)
MWFVVTVVRQYALRVTGQPEKRRLTILYYHGIAYEERVRFVRQMEVLRRVGRVVPASYGGVLPPGKNHVAITFDDAFVSVRENAIPDLLKRSFHSTIFVPTAFLGRRPGWMMEGNEQSCNEIVMTVDQLKELPSDLVSLGSHSSTHVHLSQTQRDRAQQEIEGSRHELERLIGREVRLFSFPYGDHDPSVVELCRMAGYEHAFTIHPERIKTEALSMLRGRVKVDPSDWQVEFFLKLSGAYEWMALWTIFKRWTWSMTQVRDVKRANRYPPPSPGPDRSLR